MKFKLKTIKNKKLVFILFVLSAILLLGVTFNLCKDLKTNSDCKVVINYEFVDPYGVMRRFDVYSEEHAVGERIYIVSPQKEGYSPDREIIRTTVDSNMVLTVTYTHSHPDCLVERVVRYPTEDTDGIIRKECSKCSYYEQDEFTSLTRTLVFGGDSLNYFTSTTQIGSKNSEYYEFKSETLILHKKGSTEFDVILDGLSFDSSEGLPLNAKVTLIYDEYVWGDNAVAFKRGSKDDSGTDFFIRVADNWRVIFGSQSRWGGDFDEWFVSPDCPLKTSPITIVLTCDFV